MKSIEGFRASQKAQLHRRYFADFLDQLNESGDVVFIPKPDHIRDMAHTRWAIFSAARFRHKSISTLIGSLNGREGFQVTLK